MEGAAPKGDGGGFLIALGCRDARFCVAAGGKKPPRLPRTARCDTLKAAGQNFIH